MRFNRATRLLGTVLFILQTVSKKHREGDLGKSMIKRYYSQILMTGLVIYGPAVALNQGQCTRISHLGLDSVSRTLEGSSATLGAVVCLTLLLSPVTGIDLWGGIISTGVVCTVYCTLVSTHINLVRRCHSTQYWATLSSQRLSNFIFLRFCRLKHGYLMTSCFFHCYRVE